MTTGYPEDIRALKRTKAEAQAPWLIWRKGRFSPTELRSIKEGLESWVNERSEETSSSREEILESLKWARENKLTAWCEIATRCALPERKIGAIRHCILRRMLPGCEKARWTKEETAEFVRLQEAYGERAWKQIAQDTGRTLEDVVNKGRQMEESRKIKSQATTRFSREETLRVKLAKLLREDVDSNPYEVSAIRPDCKLVALIRKYAFPDGSFDNIHDMPNSKLSKKLNIPPTQVRVRWHHTVLPEVIRRVSRKLNDDNSMDAFLVLRLRKACRGELIDRNGIQIFPCSDWCGIDWRNLMPMWPQGVTENRLRQVMRAQPKFGILHLPNITELTAKTLLQTQSKSEIYRAATRHFDEMKSILNLIADRGDQYLLKDLD